MNLAYTHENNPLVQGIRIIGVGKHGSKPLPEPLVQEIKDFLIKGENIVPVQLGAFYGALMAKQPAEHEKVLLESHEEGGELNLEKLYHDVFPDTPPFMKNTGMKLLKKENLSLSESEYLGKYLFSDLPGEAFRGMAASMLRIRYETEEEYHGLMKAAEKTFSEGFKSPGPKGENLIQLAEPFDGTEHSYMITPLLAQAFQQEGYEVVSMTGRSSGPKITLNSLDIYKGLGCRFMKSTAELQEEAPLFGLAIDQKDLSPALDEWTNRRRLIFKRPFPATLEKVLNPCGAKILVTSVFHITYMEKMVKLADMAGFRGVIVLKRGLEGSLAPSLAKSSGILCAAKQPDGSFLTHTISSEDEVYAAYRKEADDITDPLLAEDNIRLIRQFAENGTTGKPDFDMRVKLGTAMFKDGLKWIKENTAR